ncbi:hypothetical protein GCM10027346_04250 [Hymenobacter seoulensis]
MRLQAGSIKPAILSIDALLKRHYFHELLGLHPWHWHHRTPPKLVRQLAAQHLLTTFFAWQPVLASLGEPSVSTIWLVGPAFAHSSEVVVSIRENRRQYLESDHEPDPARPPLPIEYAELPGADKLTWRTQPYEVWHEADDYPDGWPDDFLRRPHYEYEYPDGARYLVVQTGWMWVGQLL